MKPVMTVSSFSHAVSFDIELSSRATCHGSSPSLASMESAVTGVPFEPVPIFVCKNRSYLVSRPVGLFSVMLDLSMKMSAQRFLLRGLI